MASAEPLRTRVGEEMADVVQCDVVLDLVRLADVLGLDLATEAERKLDRAAERFPALR